MIRSWAFIRLLAGLLLVAALGPPPARADDLEIASRSVVRVLSAVVIGDQLLDLSTGSGFAVAPDRIVTNAHVVANGRPLPRAHFVRIIPSDGRGIREAWLLHYDPDRDLAVLRVSDPVKPIAIYTGELQSDTEVRAFGYPGNVDRAMSDDPMDSFVSMPPVRSRGIVSGFRPYGSIEALLTDAPIAAGHSGGPLTDLCGRVLGVNTVLTGARGGEAGFTFAISRQNLIEFLEETDVAHIAHAMPCISREDFAERQARLATAQAVSLPSENPGGVAEEQLPSPPSRLPAFALAAALMIGGGILLWRRRNGWGTLALTVGLAWFAATLVVRPPPTVAPKAAEMEASAPETAETSFACTLDPERSRVLHSDPRDLEFRWRTDGCANNRTQYLADGNIWVRSFVSERQHAVTTNRVDPNNRQFVVERGYPLPADLAKIVANQPDLGSDECSIYRSEQLAMDRAMSDFSNLIDSADEVLTYRCQIM